MNMTQPDPAGLFEPIRKKQQQPTYPAADLSVIAQLQNRPAPDGSLPPVNAMPAPAPATPQEAGALPVSNNPLVAMSQSGQLQALLKAKAEQLANQPPPENPLVKLAANGGIRKLVMAKEDQQYKQQLADWNRVTPLPGLGYPQQEPKGEEPVPPARPLDQIEQDWNRGIHQLRGSEFSNMLNLLETGQMTPEQEAKITANIEPALDSGARRDLQIARLSKDKYQQLQANYDAQMAEQQRLKSEAGLSGLNWEAYRQASTPQQEEQLRGFARGVTFQYAFTPDEDRLNSSDADIAADERAKRNFYLNEQSKYPISSMAGNMLGAMLPIGGGIGALRNVRMANALKAGPPTQATAAMVARGGAPATNTGIVAEGVSVGLPYDLASRPIGAENMTLKENLQARTRQAGFGLALGPIADMGLTKGIPLLARGVQWTGGKVSGAVNSVVKTQQKRGLDKTARELGYKDFDEFADAATEIVTDETGSRIRLKPDILNGLSEADQARAGDLLKRLNPEEATHVPGSPPVTPAEPPISRAAQDRSDETQFPLLKPDTEQGGSAIPEPAAPTIPEPDTAPAGIEGGPGAGRPAAGQAEPVVPGRTESAVETARTDFKELPVIETPLSELTLSQDVPQFKSGANESGVVEPLGGAFDRRGVGAIQVWVRNDGRKEVISGRHRLDLARRTGEETIPAQYYYESEGFTKQDAAILDALLNIRDEKGKVKDYVDYIQGTRLTEEDAIAEGILDRAMGQRAYTIATEGTETLITAHRNDRLTDEGAARIAHAAPGNERLQSVGIKAIEDGKPITVAENMVKAVRSMSDDTGPTSSLDMFGFDDSAIKEAEQLARQAGRKQDEIQKTLSAVKGASKNPTLAAKEGVDIHDPDALKRRIAELEDQKEAWKNWHTNPELVAELRSDLGLSPSVKSAEPEPEPEAPTAPEVPENQGGFFDDFDLTQPTAKELEARDKVQQAAIAKEQQAQAELEAKAKADAEVNDFELGIQGSGKDVSAKQGDMLGLGRAEEPHHTQPSLKSDEINRVNPLHIEVGILTSPGATISELVKRAKEYARSHFAGNTIKNTDSGFDIVLSMKGVKHTTSGVVGKDLIETIPYTPQILAEGKLVESTTDTRGKSGVKSIHYFELPVEINGKRFDVRATVLERSDGKYYYDHAIKKEAIPGERRSGPHSHRNLEPRLSEIAHQGDGAGTAGTRLSTEGNKSNTDTTKTTIAQKAQQDILQAEAQPPKEPPSTPLGTSLYSNPIIPAARQVANMLHLNPGGAVGGAVYGGIAAGDASEAERYSPQWWLDSVFGAAGGAVAGAAGFSAAKGAKIKGKTLFGQDSWGSQSLKYMGDKIGKIPGFGVGDKDIVPMKKQQKLLKALIERQAEKAGQYLLDNFTPSERAAMADLIEQRGIIAEGNLLHRQAQELDDFIAYTAKKMQDLGMLDDTIEPGGYLHRYYAKDLGISGLMRGLTPGGKNHERQLEPTPGNSGGF